MMDRLRAAWRRAQERAAAKYDTQAASLTGISAAQNPAVAAFRDDVLEHFPYTDEAKHWLCTAIGFEVQNLGSTSGGGYWIPEQNKVLLFTVQYEAAIHELAHAWWHTRRRGREEALMQATIALANEADPRYARMAGLAHGYIYGIPAQNWAGMLVERNDWEMYASMASGMMADLRLVPPYIRVFYEDMYLLLPDDAPSPAAVAAHG